MCKMGDLRAELQASGHKVPKKKEDGVQAVLRLRFKKSTFECTCKSCQEIL